MLTSLFDAVPSYLQVLHSQLITRDDTLRYKHSHELVLGMFVAFKSTLTITELKVSALIRESFTLTHSLLLFRMHRSPKNNE